MNSVVWVLGSGFSASLGGPLFGDLFTEALLDSIRLTFDRDPSSFESLTSLYRGGAEDRRWSYPEQFLVFVDRAAQGDFVAAKVLDLMLGRKRPPPGSTLQDELEHSAGVAIDMEALSGPSLSRVLRQYMAMACHHFLCGREIGEEWGPYEHWFGNLTSDDSVITFNYDVVVEQLALRTNRSLRVETWEQGDRGPRLFKMHGSVDWRNHGSDVRDRVAISALRDKLREPEDLPELGVPGPSKKTLRERDARIWDAAEAAIERASAVVIVGYSFPASDAAAVKLIRKLKPAVGKKPSPVHLVLGDSTTSEQHARRLTRLVLGVRGPAPDQSGQAQANRPAIVHPLWAQDFLSLYERDAILRGAGA